jgi:hypothetical protein
MSLYDLKGGNIWEAIRLLILRVDKIAISSGSTMEGGDIDGGAADSTYLLSQYIDGGNA